MAHCSCTFFSSFLDDARLLGYTNKPDEPNDEWKDEMGIRIPRLDTMSDRDDAAWRRKAMLREILE
jgi:hypothetical protein